MTNFEACDTAKILARAADCWWSQPCHALMACILITLMQDEYRGIWNHCHMDCLFNSLSSLTIYLKNIKALHFQPFVTHEGNLPVKGGFPHKVPVMQQAFPCHSMSCVFMMPPPVHAAGPPPLSGLGICFSSAMLTCQPSQKAHALLE